MKQRSISATRRLIAISIVGAVCLATISVAVATTKYFKLSTIGPGSSPYVVDTTFANIVNEAVPDYQIQVNATGTSVRQAVATAQGRSDFFMTTPNLHYLMTHEIGPFSKMKGSNKLAENLRAIYYYPMGFYHFVTYADSGIRSLDDIKGKRVFLGPPGGVGQATAGTILEAVTGLEAGKDYRVANLGWDAAAQSFQDGHIDLYVNPTLAPSPVITQAALMRKIRLLGIPANKLDTPGMKKLLTRPGYRLGQIPAGVYGTNQVNAKGVKTIVARAGLAANKNIPADVVYNMLKAYWANIGDRARNIPQLRNVTLENALDDINMPLHPGAIRYYREAGLQLPKAALE